MDSILKGNYNLEIIKFIQSFQSPALDQIFQLITMTAEEYSIIIIMSTIFWCVNKNLGYKIGLAFVSSTLVNLSVKDLFQISRPIGESGIRSLRIETALGYSFPSGHTQGAAALWTSIMLQLKKHWVYIIGTILIILVGLSRLYLGVHRPVDVVFGAILAIVFILISNLIFDIIQKNKNYFLFLIYLMPMILGMFLFHNSEYFKMSGILLSFCIGYTIETNFIKFQVKSPLLKQAVKLIIGLAVVLLIKTSVKALLPNMIIYDFLRYFLIGIWVTVGAPAIFNIRTGNKFTREKRPVNISS